MDYANELQIEKKDSNNQSSIFPKGFDQSGEEDSLLNILKSNVSPNTPLESFEDKSFTLLEPKNMVNTLPIPKATN